MVTAYVNLVNRLEHELEVAKKQNEDEELEKTRIIAENIRLQLELSIAYKQVRKLLILATAVRSF